MANEVIKSSSMLQVTNQFIEKLGKFSEATQLKFSEYEKMCVSNAIRTIDPILTANGTTWHDLDVNNVVSVLQQTAFLQLNPSATPRECYFLIRKNWDKKANRPLPPTLEFGIEGMGNDTVLRNFGVGVHDVKSYLIYEGDKFDLGETDGWETILPKHRRLWKTSKAIYAIYLVKKNDGDIEVLISEREDVKKSLLANARTNGASENLIRELDKHSLDELLTEPKWLDYKIKKEYGSKSFDTPLFSPAWTSPVSRESMIQRKLRNHAVRRYPKNFNPELQRLYEGTFEDEKYVRKNLIETEETIENAQVEYKEVSGKEKIEEKQVEEPRAEQPKKPKVEKEKLEVVEETGEIIEQETEKEAEEVEEVEEKEVAEKETEEPKDAPDWMF